MARLQPALAGLDRHRFTSTDEFAVRRRWEGYIYKYSSCIFKTHALVYAGFVRSLASMAMARQLLVYDCSRTRLWMIRIR